MIKNVLFDIGRVIIFWKPEEMAQRVCPDGETADVILHATYQGKYWQALDAGTYTVEEVIALTERELPERYRPYVRKAYDYPAYIEVNPDTVALIQKLYGEGYDLYFASNFSEKVYEVVERAGVAPYFKGHFFSFEEKIVKPSPLFFTRLCEKYRLCPAECVFFDDLPQNVAGAEQAGVHAFLFDGDTAAAYRFLKSC